MASKKSRYSEELRQVTQLLTHPTHGRSDEEAHQLQASAHWLSQQGVIDFWSNYNTSTAPQETVRVNGHSRR